MARIRKVEAGGLDLQAGSEFQAAGLLCRLTRPRPVAALLRLATSGPVLDPNGDGEGGIGADVGGDGVIFGPDGDEIPYEQAVAQRRAQGRAVGVRLPAGLTGRRVPPASGAPPWHMVDPELQHAHHRFGVSIACTVTAEDGAKQQLTLVADLAPGTYRLPIADTVEVHAWGDQQYGVNGSTFVSVQGALIAEVETAHFTAPLTLTGGFVVAPGSYVALPRAPDCARTVDCWAESLESGAFAPIVQMRGFSVGSAPFMERDYVNGRFAPQGPQRLAAYGHTLRGQSPDGSDVQPDAWGPRLYNRGTKSALVWVQYELEV